MYVYSLVLSLIYQKYNVFLKMYGFLMVAHDYKSVPQSLNNHTQDESGKIFIHLLITQKTSKKS